ncbi:MAG: polysaccharide deacetylase family protein [Duganella sp.]
MTGDLSILIYHRVLDQRDPLLPGAPDQRTFARHLRLLRRCFRILPLELALDLIAQDKLPARTLAITFDDGYADNAELALPVLRSLGMHATFFIATAYLDGGCMWNDHVIEQVRRLPAQQYTLAQRLQLIDDILARLKYLPFAERQQRAIELGATPLRPLMMTGAQVGQLAAAGMGIGAHTHRHPILACMDDHEAARDIATGKALLEQLCGQPVTLFAYPNGRPGADYRPQHANMLRSLGFRAALSTSAGITRPGSDLFQLARYTPWQTGSARFLLAMLLNRYRTGALHGASC